MTGTDKGPVGIFDSGFGGLTVFREIRRRFPEYGYIYLGDNARTPYGNRSFEAVLKFTWQGVRHLFDLGCPLVIIACNTSSAKALRTIQQRHLPAGTFRRVLGVIRPTVEAMGKLTSSRAVALWGTKGTVDSGSFLLEADKHAPGIRLYQQACPMLVPLVEAGELEGAGLEYFIGKYWEQTTRQAGNIDTLLLACTHYPLLREQIARVVPGHIRIVSQDQLVAPSLEDYLSRHPEIESRITRDGLCRYLTTDRCDHFDKLAEVFMGQEISSEQVELDEDRH
jgi:glutamate racemase